MPKLTQSVAENASLSSTGQSFIRDSELAGFALRVTTGTKSFVLEKRIHGKMRRVTIGRFGMLTVDEARQQAALLATEISRGLVPKSIRRKPSFGELADLYLERHVPGKRSGRNDRAVLRNHLAGWRSRTLIEITRDDVARLHAEIGQAAPYQANRVVALLRKMFNLAVTWGLFGGENPAAQIAFYPEEKRQRFLQPDELPRVFEALKEEKNEYVRVAFVTAILTGARREEVLTMKWEDLNLERAVWRVPQGNGAPPHVIPLPGLLVNLLQQQRRVGSNPYVFVGEGAQGHLVNVKRTWHRIRTKAGITDVRIHDLRRTFAAWLSAAGEGLSVVGQIMNHRSPVTTAGYGALRVDPIREALERNARRMVFAGGKIGPAFANQKPAATDQSNPLLILTAPEPELKKNESH